MRFILLYVLVINILYTYISILFDFFYLFFYLSTVMYSEIKSNEPYRIAYF